MPTFILILADEPFDADDPGDAPFVQVVQHGGDNNAATPATLALRRCLGAIHERPEGAPAVAEEGEYDLRDDLNAIAEALTDGVEIMKEVAAGQHAEQFAPEDLPGRLRFTAHGAADHLALALTAFREVADWSIPEGHDA